MTKNNTLQTKRINYTESIIFKSIQFMIFSLLVILFRLAYGLNGEYFYDYMSYIFAAGMFLVILMPPLGHIKMPFFSASVLDKRDQMEVKFDEKFLES